MQLSVTVSGTKAELAAQFLSLAGAFGATPQSGNTAAVEERDDGDEQAETPAPKKRGRPPKISAPTAGIDDENENGEEPDATDGDDAFGSDDAPAKLTRDDVSKGFRAYAGDHGAPAAKKILDRFGVKSVKDLGEEQFELAMKALAKKPK